MSDFTFEKIQEATKELNSLTGQDWKAINETSETYHTPHYRLNLKDGNGESLYFRKKDKKIHIAGSFYVNREQLKPNYYPSINCSPNKTPLQIAKDIKRRLLPNYLEEFSAAYATYLKWQEIYKKQAEHLNKFAQIIGIKEEFKPGGKETIRLYDKIRKIQVSTSEKVYIELCLPSNEAELLLKNLM